MWADRLSDIHSFYAHMDNIIVAAAPPSLISRKHQNFWSGRNITGVYYFIPISYEGIHV